MKFDHKKTADRGLEVVITLTPADLESMTSSSALGSLNWVKTDYCVECKNRQRYTIETYGDIAANLEAMATCMKETGNPSYALSKGKC